MEVQDRDEVGAVAVAGASVILPAANPTIR